MNGQAVPVKVMTAYRRSENMAPLILNIGVRYIWMLSFTPRSIYCQGRSQRYALNRMVCGRSKGRSGRFGKTKNKNIFHRPEIESWFLVHSAHSLVTIPTTIPPLLIILAHYFIWPILFVSFCGLAYHVTIGPLNDALTRASSKTDKTTVVQKVNDTDRKARLNCMYRCLHGVYAAETNLHSASYVPHTVH
jgi:hypothetical protein